MCRLWPAARPLLRLDAVLEFLQKGRRWPLEPIMISAEHRPKRGSYRRSIQRQGFGLVLIVGDRPDYGARSPTQRFFRSSRPNCEIRHARQRRNVDVRSVTQCARNSVEQRTQDSRLCLTEARPQLLLRPPFCVRDFRQIQHESAIQSVSTDYHTGNAVQQNGPLGNKECFLGVRVKLPCREATSCSKAAQPVGQPRRKVRNVVECHYPTVLRCDHDVADVTWRRAQRRFVGVNQGPQKFTGGTFRGALFALEN